MILNLFKWLLYSLILFVQLYVFFLENPFTLSQVIGLAIFFGFFAGLFNSILEQLKNLNNKISNETDEILSQ